MKKNNNSSVEDNIRLVNYVIRRCFKYKTKTLSGLKLTWDDLYQQGRLGLIEASKNYDLSRGIRFSTYACRLITDYIRKMIKDSYKNSLAPLISDIPSRETMDRVEMLMDFERCCKKHLDDESAEIVYEHIFEGLTFEEVAEKHQMINKMQAFRIYSESIRKVKKYINNEPSFIQSPLQEKRKKCI